MVEIERIRAHMEVVDWDGQHIGTVDRVEGFQLKLARSDPAAHGEHRYIPIADIEEVGETVRLRAPAYGSPDKQG